MNALDFLDALPIMLWTARADGVWTHVNPRWENYTGYQGDTPGYFGFEAALHPDDVGSTVVQWTEAVTSGTPYRAEYRLRRSDGVYRWYLTQGVKSPHQNVDVVWTGACTDIHDQKQAEQDAQNAREAAVRALGLMLEAKDHETKGHTDRVTGLALRLGSLAGLSVANLEALRLGAYLHDVGKITVPDAILLKPGTLTQDERQIMQDHVINGGQFSSALGFLTDEVLQVIGGHHERWDGSGYPAGLKGTEIPLLARIFALADVYDALISERPYKKAWTSEEALAEVGAQAGRHFDPELTLLFTEVVKTERTNTFSVSSRTCASSPVHLSEHIRALALEEAAVSVLITDAEQRLVYVNPAFCRITGYSREEVLGRNPRFLQGDDTSPEDKKALRDNLKAEQVTHQRILNYNRRGEQLWFEMHITPIFVQGRLAYFVAVQGDSSAQVVARQQLEWAASHDALTGLLNRSSLDTVASALTQACVVIFLDLNDLKGINDRHGHASGDQVIRAVARMLLDQVPEESNVFRLGGDEFLILIPGVAAQDGHEWISRLRDALTGINTGDGDLSGSFGMAHFPEEGQNLWHLIGLADQRMYQDKLGHVNRRGTRSVSPD
ncbi:HD domain-containing phosphohydrolase [Deinococcus altitudinis]|uniref:HD domain-containing phosphohydrolase n=1 Tax=Deinococcus altitudinis TaxID=468914 RepID=UPI003891DBC7